ncbi:plant intracellular Ras-group-related LRR protein 5-like [Punica granatum]|uniref:Plant intracellular Ras-group-related LRR protein 5-like n=2 Tax=Punica granatum TaxID=22663 RepID=A0A218VV66_PUNGR|nr:plant intracellular Ras-group-related LRR protein 5-like [Punica granatum]OWM64118.1 hypothetical protein CDL15_Pgr018689 [Punica granatum]
MALPEKQNFGNPPAAVVEAIGEIMAVQRSLPPRPSIEEVEAAESILMMVESEEKAKLEDVSKLEFSKDIPQELCSVLREVKRTLVLFQSLQQRKEAAFLVEAERLFQAFDGLIRRANGVVTGKADEDVSVEELKDEAGGEIPGEALTLVKQKKKLLSDAGVLKAPVRSSSTIETISDLKEGEFEKLSLMKVAALIEHTAKTNSATLDLRGRLIDPIEWLPFSIGKLTEVTELDLSDNRIMALPNSMGNMRALTKLDVHSNQIINLPETIGELANLKDLDCHANRFRSLPASFRNLTSLLNLDLSSNGYVQLPNVIGSLTSLERLNVETNELEELPYTIGSCSSLIELRLDFNRLKALPEAIGRLERLQILSLHYNRIKGLPTTMSNLSNLRELDVSFNELELIPESLCFAVGLVKLNVGRNFADLRALPRSIGNLEMLEELDISYNQIRALPDSFGLLSRLRVFRADETPLELPPREIAKLGPQAVLDYMIDHVSSTDAKFQASKKNKKKKKKGLWLWLCCFTRA